MNNYNLKNTAVLPQDNLDDDRNSIYFQWYSPALNIYESNTFTALMSKAKTKTPNNICNISLLNKSVELINVLQFV